MTEEEWKRAGSLNVPSAVSTQTTFRPTFLEGHVSEIYVGYIEMGYSSGNIVPLEQAKTDSKRLLPNDAVVVTEFTIYDDADTPSALEVYRSASLADLFKATPDAWKGGQPGTFSVNFSIGGEKASNFIISIGQAEIPETDPIAIVNDNDVNFRDGPGFNYKSMEKLTKGTRLFVRGRDSTSKWLYVAMHDASKANLVNKEGWIMTQYTNFSGNLASLYEQSAPPTPDPREARTSYGGGTRLSIAATRFDDETQIGYDSAGSNGKFIVFAVGFTNRSTESVSVSVSSFTLLSSSRESVSYDVATFHYDNYLRSVRLIPDANAQGIVAFRVRNDFMPSQLVYEDFLHDTITLDVKP